MRMMCEGGRHDSTKQITIVLLYRGISRDGLPMFLAGLGLCGALNNSLRASRDKLKQTRYQQERERSRHFADYPLVTHIT